MVRRPVGAAAKAAALSIVRRRDPLVLWPPHDVGIGNILYFWLQAHARQARGEAVVVRWTEVMAAWTQWFPWVFESLVTRDGEFSLFNPRSYGQFFQELGLDYSVDDLERFIDEVLLPEGAPFRRLAARHRGQGDLTVNVRRGDYYSDPRFRGFYSFDVVEYLRLAVGRANDQAPVRSILLVSDDLGWCRAKLGWLEEIAPVRTAPEASTVADQLAMIAASPRLVLANSSFSYWGAYLSNRLQVLDGVGASHADVIAPWFHSRQSHGGAAYQLDPRWTVVRNLPGGWDA
ncbi:hypothetical protein GCM10027053_30270 [Intrasporangium mesophilum]